MMKNMKSKNSLHLYKELAAMRKKPTFWSNKIIYHIITNEIFSYIRPSSYGSTKSYLVILNVGYKISTENYSHHKNISEYGISMLITPGVQNGSLLPGNMICLEKLTLHPGDGIILEL